MLTIANFNTIFIKISAYRSNFLIFFDNNKEKDNYYKIKKIYISLKNNLSNILIHKKVL